MKILVPLDFGDSSREALRQARALAHEVEGTLAVCHVLPGPAGVALAIPELSAAMIGESYANDGRVRAALVAHARAELGLELTEVYVDHGTTYAEIVRRAESVNADLIVIGSHGRTGLARAMLGSVAESVVRYAHCSVLVARAKPKARGVLVATDLSDPSLPAIAAGAEEARLRGVPLTVVTVLEYAFGIPFPALGMLGALPALPTAEMQEQGRRALQSTLEAALQRARAEGEAVVRLGSPASEIVTLADEIEAELVVVGTRGRTGLARLALGSVAERVLRAVDSSVMAVRLSSP
ncbi:MAG: universal stress protein [Polyangiaceae bacterium]|nr:universal stress protein [Polyangiaceae bacterium]